MRWDASDLFEGLTSFEDKMERAVEIYGDTAGKKLEAIAKVEAPWENHTGNARKTITGGSEWDGDKRRIYVAGNMDYSVYLELAMEKKYAILWPTVLKTSTEILNGLANLLNK